MKEEKEGFKLTADFINAASQMTEVASELASIKAFKGYPICDILRVVQILSMNRMTEELISMNRSMTGTFTKSKLVF